MTVRQLFHLVALASVGLGILFAMRGDTFPALLTAAMAVASIANAARAPNKKISMRDSIDQVVPR